LVFFILLDFILIPRDWCEDLSKPF
jgi:hypothetical protein